MFNLTVEINTENEVFEGNEHEETMRILERVVERIRNGETGGKCMDTNGNSVGVWEISE